MFFKRSGEEYSYGFLSNLPESEYEYYLEKIYCARTGLKLNLKTPARFNEKLQYLKLYDNTAEKSFCADKVLVRGYFIDKTGSSSHLKELLGIYNSFDEIDFSKLPEKFLIQTNHGSKMLFKIKNKTLMLEKARAQMKKRFDDWLGYNFAFCAGFELQYKNIKPKILIEKLYENDDNTPVKDIMFFCFDGKPEFVQSIVFDGNKDNNKYALYNMNWKQHPCCQWKKEQTGTVDKPACFNEMLEISKILSKGFKFVRVDFMLAADDFYFLELTFTPYSGFVRFVPDKYDFYFGSFLRI